MRNKFTRGPWSVRHTNELGRSTVEIAHGDGRTQTHATIHPGLLGNPDAEPQQLANAQLIAAAPELLEALENFRKTFPVSPDGQVILNAEFKLYDFCRAVDELIKKARGES